MAAPQPTTDDEIPFVPGDRVFDRRNLLDTSEEVRPAIVVSIRETAADETELPDGSTVADYNPGYPADDAVARIAFVATLTSNVGDRWEEWAGDEFETNLRAFCTEWGIPLESWLYDYPVSRLTPPGGR